MRPNDSISVGVLGNTAIGKGVCHSRSIQVRAKVTGLAAITARPTKSSSFALGN